LRRLSFFPAKALSAHLSETLLIHFTASVSLE
jgi:hypothetical protein